jgi:hypothetical protein
MNYRNSKREPKDFQIIAAELKKDIITSVASMFVELKGDMKSMEARLGGKIDKLGNKVNNLRGKIGNAQTKILAHEGVVKNHEDRINYLEQDMKA